MPPILHKLLSSSRTKHVQKGQILLYAGDLPKEVFIIKKGIVKLYNIDEQGNEKVLHLLRAPMVVPLEFFSHPDKGTEWYYTALTDCDMYIVLRSVLDTLMETDASTMHFLIQNYSEEVHEILTRLDSLGKSDTDTKLTIALQYLALSHGLEGRGGWWKITFPVTHQLLADMTGVSRETVSLAMKILSDERLIRSPRLARVDVNLEKLQAYRQSKIEDNIAS